MPIEMTCDQCQSHYHLKDEYAGQKLRCKKCGNVLEVPQAVQLEEVPSVDRGYHPAFARDKFLMNQKRMAISEKYYVFDERQNPILFIERPAHFFRSLLAVFAGFCTALLLVAAFVILGLALGDNKGGGNTLGGVIIIVGVFLAIVLAIVVGGLADPEAAHLGLHRRHEAASPAGDPPGPEVQLYPGDVYAPGPGGRAPGPVREELPL